MQWKYVPKSRNKRKTDPNNWISGPDPLTHDKYYAWLKHKAQAKFRHEIHELTWEDWQQLWPNELFEKRGRKSDDYCICLIDEYDGWVLGNVEVTSRLEHLRKMKCKKQ